MHIHQLNEISASDIIYTSIDVDIDDIYNYLLEMRRYIFKTKTNYYAIIWEKTGELKLVRYEENCSDKLHHTTFELTISSWLPDDLDELYECLVNPMVA